MIGGPDRQTDRQQPYTDERQHGLCVTIKKQDCIDERQRFIVPVLYTAGSE